MKRVGWIVWVLGACVAPSSLAVAQPQPDQGGEEEDTNWPETISRLRQQVYERPGHAQTRQQLAIAYNNYGVSLGNQGQWALAAQQMQEAIRLGGEGEQFRMNLANIRLNQAHEAIQRHDLTTAMEALEETIELRPNLAQAYAMLGEIQYEKQQLKEAKASWERAAELDPSQGGLAERLERVRQELPIESKFERLSQAFFDLRYEEHLERPVGFDVRDALLQARRHVGSDVAYWPKHKLVVLIYSAEHFRALRQETPDWVAGQFDGKIRVPLPSEQLDQATVKQILFHEYTHALVHDLAQGKCPSWLNEGLAEYEGRTQLRGSVQLLMRAHHANRLIPWRELSDHISISLPAEEVGLAYEQSYSIVTYLVERYGFWRVRRVLKGIADGKPWEATLADELRLKLPKLESRWLEWLPEFLNSHSS